MSFVRPEVGKWLYRWRESIAAAVLTGLGALILLRGIDRYNWMQEALGAILLVVGGLLFFATLQRNRFYDQNDGPGVVEITERQITYLTSDEGASVDIAAMTRLELRSSIRHGHEWVLKHSEGATLYIPTSAAGAESLFDAFSSLPGMEPQKLVAAIKDKSDQRQNIWRRKTDLQSLS